MLHINGLTKRYGKLLANAHLSFDVLPGRSTIVFREERDRGCAVLISTHMLDSVSELWDDLRILMNGKIAAARTRAEVDASGESLEELFFDITERKEAGAQ